MAILTRDPGAHVAPAGPTSTTVSNERPSLLPLVALVLGIAGTTLAITVIWCFAAIPLGVAALATGLMGLRGADPQLPHLRTRATIGAVLGAVALVLGIAGAYFLPKFVDRADRFFGAVQADVDTNVATITETLRDDVRSLDRTMTRDLRRFEAQNGKDLTALEQRTNDSLTELAHRVDAMAATAESSSRHDLVTLEASLREDIRAIDAAVRATNETISSQLSAMEQRVEALERRAREALG